MAVKSEYEPFLEVEIKKKLKDFTLETKFEARKGCLGILGPSGCGKSMTLKSIAGLVRPDQGRIALAFARGEAAGGLVFYDSALKINQKPQKRKVGYLFQNYALFPNMTVRQNIACGLKRGAGREGEALVDQLISRFRLEGLEERYPDRLSGGQQQRAALARILASDPQILLFDEPFSAMDTYLREGLRLELAHVLAECGKIAVLVTHDRDEAYQLCSHLLLMDQGRPLAWGTTRDIFEHPENCQTARLTGCKNLSRIEILGERRLKALDWQGLELETDRPLDASIEAVGIRAHDFEPLSQSEAQEWKDRPGANLIPVHNPKISEMPFEWYITLDNGLWWKTEKNLRAHSPGEVIPPWLRIPPKALLLLKGQP